MTIELRSVTKTFGTGHSAVQALRGIDLQVKPGELMMLVGPSGCGKTTLLSVIAGILERDGGELSVLEKDWQRLSSDESATLRSNKLGFVFQTYHLVPTISIAENISVPLLILGEERTKALSRAADLLKEVGLGDRSESLPRELSGGERQRTAICRALIHDPALIVCDEPTSALDHETGMHIMELLRARAVKEGRSLIVVTHDARIFKFADRIATMDDGRIVKVYDSPEEMEA